MRLMIETLRDGGAVVEETQVSDDTAEWVFAGSVAAAIEYIAGRLGYSLADCQSELVARIIARPDPVAEPKAHPLKWIPHNGAVCPVDGDAMVDALRRDRHILECRRASGLNWHNACADEDIVAWRLAPQSDADDGA